MPITEPIDEDELEADLAALEQENLDEKMLKTGTMPVADSLNRLPQAANGERKSRLLSSPLFIISHQSIVSIRRKQNKESRVLTRTNKQSKGNRKRRSSKKKTRRRSCGSCRPRWRCERASGTRGITETNWDRIFHSRPRFFFFCYLDEAYFTRF